MNIEQCIEIMQSLRDAYQQMSSKSGISLNKYLELKNAAMELKLVMISIEKSLQQIGMQHEKNTILKEPI